MEYSGPKSGPSLERRPVLVRKKLEADQILHVERAATPLAIVDRRLDHLEHAGLVANQQSAGLVRGLTELASLARAPFRVEIAGRDNGDQDSRLPELSATISLEKTSLS